MEATAASVILEPRSNDNMCKNLTNNNIIFLNNEDFMGLIAYTKIELASNIYG